VPAGIRHELAGHGDDPDRAQALGHAAFLVQVNAVVALNGS
jgi:hypothetical protein